MLIVSPLISKVALHFKIGLGTAHSCVRRVTLALCAVQQEVIAWPNERERAEIAACYGRHYHFINCVGCIDGSCVVLCCEPSWFGGDFFDRKSNYSINCQIVVDPDGRIRCFCANVTTTMLSFSSMLLYFRCFYVGLPGSQHDSFCWG